MTGVLNTRPAEQAAALSDLLRTRGYLPVEIPLVELSLLSAGISAMLEFLPGDYDGILMSSPSLPPLLQKELSPGRLRAFTNKPWYLVSARARAQAEALGAQVAFAPQNPSLQGFLDEFPSRPGLRLLHPCSESTRLFPGAFLERDIAVRNIPVYAPSLPAAAPEALAVAWPKLRAAIFASGSAVNNLFAAAPALGRTLGKPEAPVPVSIGPSASEALREHGVGNFCESASADNAGLIAALDAALAGEKKLSGRSS